MPGSVGRQLGHQREGGYESEEKIGGEDDSMTPQPRMGAVGNHLIFIAQGQRSVKNKRDERVVSRRVLVTRCLLTVAGQVVVDVVAVALGIGLQIVVKFPAKGRIGAVPLVSDRLMAIVA